MLPVQKEGQPYSYADYLKWPEGERWELIEGVAYAKEGGIQAMSPAPSRRHQEVLVQLLTTIHLFLQGKPCKVYPAPFDIRLPKKSKTESHIHTVVQPDIAVICDQSKLDDKGCLGAPDWLIEVVSPSSGAMDYVKKLNLYEQNGVKEYWVVHPFDETVMVFTLGPEGSYGRPATYTSEELVSVTIFNHELSIDLKQIFAE